ncbi:hypothetical protein M6B38_143040 [Iris pallida]|uniref:Uncharacterized protein n=1 Tax=Iris pallida TaxID=29817 RepID=A0AAX6FBR9_IRIPA|nr:hypothetical protein M6B38_143040 [Iris pallida]
MMMIYTHTPCPPKAFWIYLNDRRRSREKTFGLIFWVHVGYTKT